MKYIPEVKKDLFKVFTIILVFSGILVALKLYDTKTNRIAKVGNSILNGIIK